MSSRSPQRLLRSSARTLVRAGWTALHRGGLHVRSLIGRQAQPPPAWEADVLDDLAFNRPWNLLVKVLRLWARMSGRTRKAGTTIVIVNWNTCAVTQDTVHAVRALTPPSVNVMIVDNGSVDGSREWLREQTGIRTLLLPANAGHAIALDVATLLARTEVVVTLDSDAVPLRDGWHEVVLDKLAVDSVVLAGLRSSRDFVHPVFSGLKVRDFVDRRLSFQVHRELGVHAGNAQWGINCWDTGELMTARLEDREVDFVNPTQNLVDGLPGMTTGGVVYHHGGVTRQAESGVDAAHDESYRQWRAAIERILPASAIRPVTT